MTHSSAPTNLATIIAIELSDNKMIKLTTAEPHHFKSKRTCGQLYAAEGSELGVLAPLLKTALKVANVPSPQQFTIQSSVKDLQQEQLAAISTQLQMGACHLTFG